MGPGKQQHPPGQPVKHRHQAHLRASGRASLLESWVSLQRAELGSQTPSLPLWRGEEVEGEEEVDEASGGGQASL